jgi:hypothetical protein
MHQAQDAVIVLDNFSKSPDHPAALSSCAFRVGRRSSKNGQPAASPDRNKPHTVRFTRTIASDLFFQGHTQINILCDAVGQGLPRQAGAHRITHESFSEWNRIAILCLP